MLRRLAAVPQFAVVIVVLFVWLAAGCGGDGDDEAAQQTTAATTGATEDLSGRQVTWVSFGGDVQAAEGAAWLKPYSEMTGLKIVEDNVDYAKVKAQVDSGNVTWNIVHADTFFIQQNCGTLFEPLSKGVLESTKLYPGFVTNDCGAPITLFSWVPVYDKDKFGSDPPSSWADFFNTDKYPGKRCMWNFVVGGALEGALLADGVKPADLYPLDVERALRKLDTIKGDIIWGETPSQPRQVMIDGGASMCITNQAHLYSAVKGGANWDAVWAQNLRTWDNLGIVKGTEDKEAAEALLTYVLTPEAQAAFTEEIPFAATTPDAKPQVDELTKSMLPSTPSNFDQGVDMDQDYWTENYDKTNQQWTQWQAG